MKINIANDKYKVGWIISIPKTPYYIAWLKGIKIIIILEKSMDCRGYYFHRLGDNRRVG